MLSLWKSGIGLSAILVALTVANMNAVAVAQKASNPISVELVGGSASDAESADVLGALKKLLAGLGQRNLELIGACLSEDVVAFDDHNGKLMSGKEAVLEQIKKNVIGTKDQSPVKRIVVHDPFVRVKGDTAMVSFRATKELADEQKSKLESWCSEVFERKDGQWLVLQYRSNWKPSRSPD